MELTKALEWRYATKKFDTEKKVSEKDLAAIKEAIRLSPSSIGLQPYVVLTVKDPAIRQQLQPLAWGQPQITEASHLLVFCNMTSLPAEYIDACAELHRSERNGDEAMVQQFKGVAAKISSDKNAEQLAAWTAHETFISVGIAIAACAELKIDACPMGGFEPKEVNRILGLDAQGLNAVHILPIGYRSAEDAYEKLPKVRKPETMLFPEI